MCGACLSLKSEHDDDGGGGDVCGSCGGCLGLGLLLRGRQRAPARLDAMDENALSVVLSFLPAHEVGGLIE